MAIYRFARPEGDVAGITPATPPSNVLSIETIAARRARVLELGVGGGDVQNVSMFTRICRDTVVGTGARTSLTPATEEPTENPTNAFVVTTYASTQPTNSASQLYFKGWNSNGGLWGKEFPPGRGFHLVGAASLTMRQVSGQGTMTADGAYEE